MKEQILQFINNYLPTMFMVIVAWIVRWGVGKMSSAFKKEISDELNVKEINKTAKDIQAEIRSTKEEINELKDELKLTVDELRKIKGARK